MNLADNLKKIRKEHNLSQEQLAEALGVSRQAVSKWESNGAYPEMDKVLQLCQMFNLNIDDLLNQDIKEVNSVKQEKSNINKFIDDFLDYITKTVDMFSSMKFKEKVKCIFEQLLLIGVMTLLFLIIGGIFGNIAYSILQFLPDKAYQVIYCILEGIYLAFCLVLGIILLLHIFKVRYLDYYIIVKEDKDKSKEEQTEKQKDKVGKETKEKEPKKILLEKNQEKIIIRDPKHSEYRFISGLLKILLFILKSIIAFIAICFCITLIVLAIITVISFTFIKTGLVFVGSFLTLISCIIINLIILIILYNFIVNKKTKKGKLAISFIISLILIGMGIGMIFIGIPEFDIITDTNSEVFTEDEFTLQMKEDLFFEDYHSNIKYIEDNNNDIKIVYKHTSYYDMEMYSDNNNHIYFHLYLVDDNMMNIVKNTIKDINNKKIIDYSNYEIYIYASKENIETLKQNQNKFFEEQEQNEMDNLYEIINEKDNQIYNLEEQLEEKDSRINELEEELNYYNSNYNE